MCRDFCMKHKYSILVGLTSVLCTTCQLPSDACLDISRNGSDFPMKSCNTKNRRSLEMLKMLCIRKGYMYIKLNTYPSNSLKSFKEMGKTVLRIHSKTHGNIFT